MDICSGYTQCSPTKHTSKVTHHDRMYIYMLTCCPVIRKNESRSPTHAILKNCFQKLDTKCYGYSLRTPRRHHCCRILHSMRLANSGFLYTMQTSDIFLHLAAITSEAATTCHGFSATSKFATSRHGVASTSSLLDTRPTTPAIRSATTK